MKITRIVVNAGRTLPHPCQSYANLRPSVTMEAQLDESEDPREAVRHLQIQAERAVEEHAATLIASLEERQVMETEIAEIGRLERSMADGQSRLEKLKQQAMERTKKLTQNELFTSEERDEPVLP